MRPRTVLREAARLPEPGETFRSLTITNRAVRGGDPAPFARCSAP